ncbi:mediator of RNA polymerase II transcription subunit 11 isoform X1 [Canis lupus baileyi]|uniref:mediator of RNA polymerase II transcription subunit 11 isoform X1 n=1 Tax=Canis lupus familiaris TaxID=9615 RepID=UPI0006B3E1B1|nr:mediator of RNA polymerase II transcription subunit 11 isoform X1 [Canis lupus familiaris]XP_025284459.1 mediator of RNA polymerase II transcription subunit 11 isoform X1 [Canis lupus dingo]XP_038392517.1 mediator of RNA polymerase II transcription subunit 11 isoform X1 [Canis lupus familiaris]XP_038521245.1 mediator of RNA polymerase II transcription subunit 11 isoform X1 [Canis lupus familiaris]|eukprot:XP_013968983.1 mediator of RNA polymerase II transcription subunit 11 isoform X1 [Canis lupus familiaris]
MATYSLANERLRALEDIEREIGAILQNAGTVILELSKEKTNERLLDRQAAAFTASVQHVEAELSAQIRYLTQPASQPASRDPGLGDPSRPSFSFLKEILKGGPAQFTGGHGAAPRGLQLLFQKGLSDGPEASGLCSPQAQ